MAFIIYTPLILLKENLLIWVQSPELILKRKKNVGWKKRRERRRKLDMELFVCNPSTGEVETSRFFMLTSHPAYPTCWASRQWETLSHLRKVWTTLRNKIPRLSSDLHTHMWAAVSMCTPASTQTHTCTQ